MGLCLASAQASPPHWVPPACPLQGPLPALPLDPPPLPLPEPLHPPPFHSVCPSQVPSFLSPPQEGTQRCCSCWGWGCGPRLREQLRGTQPLGATSCEPSQLPDTQLQRGQGSWRPAQWASAVQHCPGDQGGPQVPPALPASRQALAVPSLQASATPAPSLDCGPVSPPPSHLGPRLFRPFPSSVLQPSVCIPVSHKARHTSHLTWHLASKKPSESKHSLAPA